MSYTFVGVFNEFFWQPILFEFNVMLSKCLEWLKRDEFKREIKDVLHPVMELLMESLKPYLLYGVAFIFLNFILLLSIFLLMMRKKNVA